MFNLDPILKKRVNAFTIDLALVIVVNYFLMASFTDFLKIVFFHFPLTTQLHLIDKFKYIHSVSMLSLMFSYFTIFYFATNGQTMGKMMMNLRVKSSSSEMTMKESMQRAMSYIFCAWFASIPFLLSFVRKDQKSVADLFSGTTVQSINEKENVTPQTEFQLTLISSINETEVNTFEAAEEEAMTSIEPDKAA